MKKLALLSSCFILGIITFNWFYDPQPENWQVDLVYTENGFAQYIIKTEVTVKNSFDFNNNISFLKIWLRDRELYEDEHYAFLWAELPGRVHYEQPAYFGNHGDKSKTQLFMLDVPDGVYPIEIHLTTHIKDEKILYARLHELIRYSGISLSMCDRWRGRWWIKYQYKLFGKVIYAP